MQIDLQIDLLASIAVSIIFATLSALVVRKFRQPLILGYILGGILLGQKMGLGIISDEASIELISEIGLILLLFIIGLEINLTKLIDAGKTAVVAGTVQFFGCIALGVLFFGSFGFLSGRIDFNLGYLALSLSLSSTLIVVKLLYDKYEIDTLAGRTTLGILIFQDIWAIAFLAIQPNLLQPEISSLFSSLLAGAGLLSLCFFISKYLLPKLFTSIAKSPELMLTASISWCFLISGLASAVGLSKEMGALIAGLSIAAFPYSLDVVAKITGIRDFFITLFFVALGLKAPAITLHLLGMAFLVTGFVLASRLVILLPTLRLLRHDLRTALVTALNLSQVSEFSLVVVTLGAGYHQIEETVISVVILSLIVSLVFSTYLILYSEHLVRWVIRGLKRINPKEPETPLPSPPKGTRKEIVLLGFFKEASSFLFKVNQEMPSLKERIFVIDFNPQTLEILKKNGIACVYGDIAHPETLRHAGIGGAKVVLSTIPDTFLKGTTNSRLLKQIRTLCPQSAVIVTSETIREAKRFYEEGAEYVLLPRLLYARHLFDVVQTQLLEGLEALREQQISDLGERPASVRKEG
jgi:Kef-type K+ transport system membrane component KefB